MHTANLVPAVETSPMEKPKKEQKMEDGIKDEENMGSETDSEDTMDFYSKIIYSLLYPMILLIYIISNRLLLLLQSIFNGKI